MTIEEDSVEFLQKHMDTSFAHLMGKFVVDEIEWLIKEYDANDFEFFDLTIFLTVYFYIIV